MLDFAAEQEDREHVDGKMGQARMQEAVGQHLSRLEVAAFDRPQPERAHQFVA